MARYVTTCRPIGLYTPSHHINVRYARYRSVIWHCRRHNIYQLFIADSTFHEDWNVVQVHLYLKYS